MIARTLIVLWLSAVGSTVYRYRDESGQEHYVSDPALVPPEARSGATAVDLRQAPVTQAPVTHVAAPTVNPVKVDPDNATPTITTIVHGSGTDRHRTWLWATLVSLGIFLVFVIAAATVPSRYRQVSWSLSMGRYAAFLLLAATALAASYELRDDPAMQRYSPWAALQKVQQTTFEVNRRDSTLKGAVERAGEAGSPGH